YFLYNSPHISPDTCPPWPGSITTSVNGDGAAVRPVEVTGRGMESICHQMNDPAIRASPNHATTFFIVPRKPRRSGNIATFEDWNAVLRRPKFDNESRSCYRARARPLQFHPWPVA